MNVQMDKIEQKNGSNSNVKNNLENSSDVNPCSKTTNHLAVQKLSNTGEGPHKCNFCSYTSALANNLKCHMKMHSGEKSNKCKLCNFASSWKSAVIKHTAGASQTNVVNVTLHPTNLVV